MWLVSGGLGVWGGGGQGYIPGSLGSCTARYGKTQKGGGLWGEGNYETILLSR